MKKKVILILCIIYIMSTILPLFNNLNAVITSNLPKSETRYNANDNSSVFPESYKSYINNLKKEHPNWVFKAIYTNLDWNTALLHETYETKSGISTVPDTYPDAWKKDGKNYYSDGSFVIASKEAVAYCLDPRNFLNVNTVFQFETLSYSDSISSTTTIDKVLASTVMGQEAYKNKYKNAGNWVTMDKTYSEIIRDIGKKHNVSPIHIASRIKQETSGDIMNNLSINGSYKGYEGVYNFGNVKATPNADGTGSVANGLAYAKSVGWTTPEKSIDGFVDLLKKSYIQYGQDTIYFQKFDVNNPYGNASYLCGSQYMTNILAPSSEAKMSYAAYSNAGMLDCTFEFHIPVYNNMPTTAVSYPGTTTNEQYFEDDNTLIYLDDTSDTGVNDVFRIRSSPDDSTSNNIIETITETKEGAENRTKFLRTGKGVGLSWDRIQLSDGRIGYVFNGSGFVKVYKDAGVSSVTLDKSNLELDILDTYTLTATVSPSSATNKNVKYSSSDTNIVTVDSNGKVTAISPGTANITVTTEQNSKTDTCKVTVKDYSARICLDVPNDVGNTYYKSMLIGGWVLSTDEKAILKIFVDEKDISDKFNRTLRNDVFEVVGGYGGVSTNKLPGFISELDISSLSVGEHTLTIQVFNRNNKLISSLEQKFYVLSVEVESITLPNTEYTLTQNSTLELTPVITPEYAENKEYTVNVADESIVKYENGVLIAGNVGTTQVTFTTKSQNKTCTVKINVIKVDESGVLKFDENITVSTENIVTKLNSEMKVSQLKENIKSENVVYKILDKSGNELTDTSVITTNSKIVTYVNNQVKKTYTLLIYGDVNGDGRISPSDYVKVRNGILGNEKLEGIYRSAGDVNKDGKISPSDYVKIRNKILGNEDIIQ